KPPSRCRVMSRDEGGARYAEALGAPQSSGTTGTHARSADTEDQVTGGAAALALAFALAPAPVHVEAAPGPEPAETRSLRDQLMLRLLEEGYPLAPSATQATRTLRVEPTASGLRVEAEGEDTRRFEGATGPVLPLEAVHRAIEALDEVTPRPAPRGSAAPRVALHVEATPVEISPEAVRRSLVRRLLERQRTVVPLDAEPDAVLCVTDQGDA